MVKKRFLLVPAFMALIGASVYAQEKSGAQLFAFNIGASFGYDLDDAKSDQIITNGLFGFDFVISDNITAGIKTKFNATNSNAYVGFGIDYAIAKGFGVGLGFGGAGSGLSEKALDIVLFYDISATRKTSANGISQGLKVFLDYLAPVQKFGKGAFTLGVAFNFGA